MTATHPDGAAGPDPTTDFVPFGPQRAHRYRAAGYWVGKRVDALLRDAATQWPQRLAVADAETRHTFAGLDEQADRLAAGLAALGIRPGQRVLLQLPNTTRFAVALFGLLRAGAIPVLCLPGHRSTELTHFARRSGAVGAVLADNADGDARDSGAALQRGHPGLEHVVIDGDPGRFVSLSALVSDAAAPRLAGSTTTPALLLASGGTTGLPKLIPRTHDDYVYNATASAALCGLTADDVYLTVLPAAHNFPLACPGLLGAVSVGAATVFTADASPESAFAAIDRHAVTVTALVPPLAALWSQACAWEPVTPTTLRLLQVGGAKLAPEDARRIRATLTPGLQQVFGMAEGLLNFTRLDDPPEVVENTQGRPLSPADEVRVVDDAGAEVEPGAEGELWVRGPYTFNGYFADPDANRDAFSAGGFFRSGDRVRRRPDGNLEVTGRLKDVVLRAGESIAAADIEDHLLEHPSVRAVAVVGLPDEHLGEKICAAVSFRGTAATLADLNGHLAARGAATHTRLDSLVAMPHFPTTAFGKVDKKALAARLTGP